MNPLLHDIAFAWRNALKRPATSLLIIVTLALGIGANTAIFSMAWHVLLAPLPYADGERLVRMVQHEQVEGAGIRPWSRFTFEDVKTQSDVFEVMTHYAQNSLTLLRDGQPRQVDAGEVAWNYFDVLGIQPIVGRGFQQGEDEVGARPLMLLSQDIWVNDFDADPRVIGATVELNGLALTIIGVLPPMLPYPHHNDVWITQAGNPYDVKPRVGSNATRKSLELNYVFAVLRENTTLDEAARDLATVARRLIDSYPDDYYANYSIDLHHARDEMVGESAATITLLLVLALLVVSIAAANVANLNLARAASRAQEMAIREAVGANPARVRQQMMTESLLLGMGGGLVGLGLAWAGMALLKEFAARYTPLAQSMNIGISVLLFTLLLTVTVGMLSGMPSLFTRRDINKTLKEGGDKTTTSSEGTSKRKLLLAVQFALAYMMLTTAALVMLSLHRLNSQDAGYDTQQVLAMRLPFNVDLDGEPQLFPQQIRSFGISLLEQVQAIPGVSAAGFLGGRPLLQDSVYDPPLQSFALEEGGGPDNTAYGVFATASEDLFPLLDVPLLKGRMFTPNDDERAGFVALVNQNFADRYFPSGDVLGQRIRLPHQQDWRTIVGVVTNIRSRGLNQEEDAMVYFQFRQMPSDVMNLYVKSAMNAQELSGLIREIVRRIKPDQSIEDIRLLDEVRSDWLAPARLRAILISLLGVLALVVTLSGVIGVVSYNISQRVREIGIHMAIGATPARVVRLFVADGLKVYATGLLLGLALMVLAAPFLEPLLYQTSVMDVGVYLLSTLVLTLAVLGAIYLPASKAGAMSPVAALHGE